MAIPYLPLGISAAVLGGILLFAPRSEAAEEKGIPSGPPNGGGGLGPVIPNTDRRWPAGTPVGIVVVRAGDPLLGGLQPGVKVNQRPMTRASGGGAVTGVRPARGAGDPADDIASGERIAIRGDAVKNEQGTWRLIETFTGKQGYVRVIDPNGTVNIEMALESGPWPGGVDVPNVPIAGRPSPFAAYASIGAYGVPNSAGCPPGAPAAYGWAPWASAWGPARGWGAGAVRADVVGQMNAASPLAPGAPAVCVRECLLYRPFERGGGWTVGARLPVGSRVQIAPRLPLGVNLRGPGAEYVLVQTPQGGGWIHRNQLQGVRTLGLRRRPALPAPILR